LQAQLARLSLLGEITRAISERQDVPSIFQVVIRSLEEQLPAGLCCVCLYDQTENYLTVTGISPAALATELALPVDARIDIDENGLSRCVRGQLVYEPDAREAPFPFPQRLARGGLCSIVAAPLLVESKVFGVLIAARTQPRGFSSGECEFLRQLSEHVALAAQQAQLYEALQHAYDDLKLTQQAVMQQERLLALGKMASGIAHDINNAISPIALYADSMLERETTLSPTVRSNLEVIRRAIDDVASTVARMREFYRAREPQQALLPVDLNRLVPQVVDLTRARWSDMAQQRGVAVQVRTELAPNLPAVAGIEGELRDALTNLVFNSVDAMPTGGELRIRTRVIGRPAAAASTAGNEQLVQLEVSDTGVGMDEETRRRCLEPFFTTKGERGTGLGLAMVYGTMQRHGADLDVQSAVAKGTTVRLSFAVPAIAPGAAPPPAAPRAVAPLRILIVDDDPLVLKSLRVILEADGHAVTEADGGRAGIDAFMAREAAGKGFQVVITDLGMPYVDGRRVAAAVKSARPDTPVLLLTGWGRQMIMEGDVPPHVDRILSKPVKLRELREAFAQLSSQRG
jgi:signal transduction histidine kinase/ActR/RegA family two-component response regulator